MKVRKVRDFNPDDPRTWRKLLTVGQVAQILRMHRSTVRTWTDQGRLPADRHAGSGHRWYKKAAIMEYLTGVTRTSKKYRARKKLLFNGKSVERPPLNKTMYEFACAACGCHFVDDFEVTMTPSCNFWGELGLANVPRDARKILWDWMFAAPYEYLLEGYKIHLSPILNVRVSTTPTPWVTVFPGFDGLPRNEQQDLIRQYYNASDRQAFLRRYIQGFEAVKQRLAERRTYSHEVN